METLKGDGKLIRAIRELQTALNAGRPQSTPGALVSRTTRGDFVVPTARPKATRPTTASIPTWR